MWEHLGAIVALAALIFNAGTGALFLMLRNAVLQMQIKTEKTINQCKDEIGEKMSELRTEIDERIDRQSREFGETANALRQKITEVEMWSRDTFVRQEPFDKMMEILYQVRTSSVAIEARLQRMEGNGALSIDKKLEEFIKRIEGKIGGS